MFILKYAALLPHKPANKVGIVFLFRSLIQVELTGKHFFFHCPLVGN